MYFNIILKKQNIQINLNDFSKQLPLSIYTSFYDISSSIFVFI